jgi:DNA-binding response OmpR family regulator
MLSLVSDIGPKAGAPATGRSGYAGADLAGVRVLVVEDEAMVAMLIEDALLELGCLVIGPVASVSAALQLLDVETLDAAVLDVNLGGEKVFPVADRLAERGVPFLFSTGYGAVGIEQNHLDRPVLQKPYDTDRLGGALSAALRQH